MQENTASTGAFKATSGRTVVQHEDGSIGFDLGLGYVGSRVAVDAEEFFRAKRDEELGRWRWPENPDYVVYRRDAHTGDKRRVRVIHEPDGDFVDTVEGSTIDGIFKDASRAYFEAHPERKPWEEAEPGEVWVLRVKHVPGEDAYEIYDDPSQGIQRTCFRSLTDGSIYWVRSESIDDGRRIWPVDEIAPAELHESSSQAGLASIRGGL